MSKECSYNMYIPHVVYLPVILLFQPHVHWGGPSLFTMQVLHLLLQKVKFSGKQQTKGFSVKIFEFKIFYRDIDSQTPDVHWCEFTFII